MGFMSALLAPGRHIMGAASRVVGAIPGGDRVNRVARGMGGGHLGIRDTSPGASSPNRQRQGTVRSLSRGMRRTSSR